jgi:choline dehydrogenase-like flavoprotein
MEEVSGFDVIVVGSGPAGAQSALVLVENGLRVALLDVGFTDEKYGPRIPDRPFSALRAEHGAQAEYFLGENREGVFVNQSRAGAHLTPPRQHMIERSEELFPGKFINFAPLLASSRGGLGTSWGANCFSFSAQDLQRVGLPETEIRAEYNAVAAEIGVSGDPTSDISFLADFSPLQPALEVDSNAAVIYERYRQRREEIRRAGFSLGPSPLASLSQDHGGRRANQYFDMDFWVDHGQTVYRPRYTVDKLRTCENFTYLTRRLATRVRKGEGGWEVEAKEIDAGTTMFFRAKRVVLAAGALNTARLVARSLEAHEETFPLLCNPNEWIAALNLRMLGKPAKDRRHSLSQLTAAMSRTDDPDDCLIGHFYSYRSLLFFRLLKDLPFRLWIALPLVRFMATAITLVNLHYSDLPAATKKLRVSREGELEIDYEHEPGRAEADRRQRRRFLRFLVRLGVLPLKVNRPQPGASIHYAGTVPMTATYQRNRARPDGALWDMPGVYLADSSTWNFLPAKGLTFTIMAGARRVAKKVVEDLARA